MREYGEIDLELVGSRIVKMTAYDMTEICYWSNR